MGITYSATKLKVQLRTANQRMAMHINKRNNTIRADSREVAKLLQQQKDESARLKVEGIIAAKNMVLCMETLQLMCELLLQRIGVINAATKECPEDLEESIASIVYCSTRMEVNELTEISKILAAKFGKDYISSHLNNQSGKVCPRIIAKLSVRPPDFDVVINLMQEIAAQYEIDWKPDWSHLESGLDSNDPYRLGAIAKIAHSSAPVPEPTEDELKAMPVPSYANHTAPITPSIYQSSTAQPQYPPSSNYLNPHSPFPSLPTPHSSCSHHFQHPHHHSPSPSPSNNNSRGSYAGSDIVCTCGAAMSPSASAVAPISPIPEPKLSPPPAYSDPPAPHYNAGNDETNSIQKPPRSEDTFSFPAPSASSSSSSNTVPTKHVPSLKDEVDRFEVKKSSSSNSDDPFEAKKPNSSDDQDDDGKDQPGNEDDELERRFRALHTK
jgi:hypothetical protein